MMHITLRQLRVFIAVARAKSFTKAASDIGLSQSAASMCIQELEDELGVRLLDRSTRQVIPTSVGENLLPVISRLLGELEAALRETHDIGEHHRGRVTIACVPSVAGRLMPMILEECAKRFPNVEVSLHDTPALDVVKQVISGEVEFGITVAPLNPIELESEPILFDPFYIVCRRKDELNKLRFVKWEDVIGRKFLMLDWSSGSRAVIDQALAEANISLNVVLELSQPSSVLAMIKAGQGISIMPAMAVPLADHRALALKELKGRDLVRTITIIRRKGRTLSPASQVLWDLIKVTAKNWDGK